MILKALLDREWDMTSRAITPSEEEELIQKI